MAYNTLSSFSGADLLVSFGSQVIGELQQISWAIQREKAPVFTLGSSDARAFARGKRGIAGSMVFAVFDEDSLVNAIQRQWSDIAPVAMFTAAGNVAARGSDNFRDALDIAKWNNSASNTTSQGQVGSGSAAAGTGNGFGVSQTGAISANTAAASNDTPTIDSSTGEVTGWTASSQNIYVPTGFAPIRGENINYADTLPPFDITMTFANEYGQCAFQKIYDLDILNEASGVSVDTIVMERQMTYVARKVSPIIRGVYSREAGGQMKGKKGVVPTS